MYREAADRCGGLDGLYAAYFDQQFEMLQTLKPRVVGHLDLIRIFDPEYGARLVKPHIWEKILRNLKWVAKLGLILDFNLRPLSRGEKEPYLSPPILKQAIDMKIDVVPGDDSHGVYTIGTHISTAIEMLQKAGAPTDWRKPADRA
jgi:histidinol-phosphatase (PHP family)